MSASRTAATVALLAMVALSGCAAVPFVGPGCGPGGTDIGAIEGNVTGVHLKGDVTHVNESVLVLDDGTGDASVLLFDPGVSRDVAPGDCVIARDAAALETQNRSTDVVVLGGDLLKEEVVVETPA